MKELRGFCEQYESNLREIRAILNARPSPSFDAPVQGGQPGNPTEIKALKIAPLMADVRLIEQCALEAANGREDLRDALIINVTRRYGERKMGISPVSYEVVKKHRKAFYVALDRELWKRRGC